MLYWNKVLHRNVKREHRLRKPCFEHTVSFGCVLHVLTSRSNFLRPNPCSNVYDEVLISARVGLELVLVSLHLCIPFLSHSRHQMRQLRLLSNKSCTCSSLIYEISYSSIFATEVLGVFTCLRAICCFVILEPNFSLNIFNFHLLKLLLEEIKFGRVKTSTFVVGTFDYGAAVLTLILIQVVNMARRIWSVYHNQLLKVLLTIRGRNKLYVSDHSWGETSKKIILESHALLLLLWQEPNRLIVWASSSLNSQPRWW